MSKKDGLEIFELFRSGSGKSGTAEVTPPPAVKERVTSIRPAPAPAPVAAAPAAPGAKANPGEATISVRLNTALVGLMVGTACLFGCFALGVQYGRRHQTAPPAPAETAKVGDDAQAAPIPVIPREIRRETPPPSPAGETRTPPAAVEPKKGYTLMLMGYGADQESIAQRMLKKVRDAGGADCSVIKDKTGGFVVIAGFVEKQSGSDAESLLGKYRSMASRLNMPFNLNWISASK